MQSQFLQSSAFSLAKGKELKGDDFYGIRNYEDLTIGVVCDGVGGAQEGARAAKKVTNYLLQNFKNRPQSWSIEKSIKNFITSINAILYQESMQEYERVELVTTLSVVVIIGNRLYGANVGDSRIYLLRQNQLLQLSHDHVVEDEDFEGVLSQAMGLAPEVEPYYFENNLQKEDKILLCSDGLYTVLDEKTLQNGIPLGAAYLVKKASTIHKDNLPDDTTAVVIEIKEENQVALLKAQELEIPKSLKKGMIIDGYELERSLIQNERTWLCNKRGKKYVIKFAPLEAIDDELILDAFVKEVWNSKRLKAGFFPKAVVPKNRTMRYYIQEFIDGITLKEYLKKRRLHVDDAITLAKTLLKASQYLVKYDLVHGDIKPENIIVLKRGEKLIFKIIDFGSMTEIYSTSSRAGTPSYLAPERFEEASISETTEIFAIGVTLYEALTQTLPYGEIEPFSTPTFESVAKKIKSFNDNTPLWLESIVLKSIAIDPNRRYSNYSEMLYEIENPKEVQPYFQKSVPFLERNPLLFYKSIALIELLIIIYLLKEG